MPSIDGVPAGITTVNNNWGVKDGLNKIDARIGVGYEWQFSNRFALQANARRAIQLIDRFPINESIS